MNTIPQSPKCAYLTDDNLDLDGKIVYVEHEYQPVLNHYIQTHYEEIRVAWKKQGLEFVYLPKVANDLFIHGAIQYQSPKVTPLRFPYPEQQNKMLNDVLTGIEGVSAALIFVDDWEYCSANDSNYDEHDGAPIIAIPLCDDKETMSFAMRQYEDIQQTECCTHIFLSSTTNLNLEFSNRNYCKTPMIPYHAPQSKEESCCKADADFDEESKKLIQEVRVRIAQLQQKGLSAWVLQKLLQPEPTLSRLIVQKNYRIILPDYNNIEIQLSPLPRAVYFLFLRHPEGIIFKHLPDYQDELMDIYQTMTRRTNMDIVRQSIEDICNPLSNAINEKCARIREAFVRHFTDDIAKNYYIIGKRGEPKGIALERDLVLMECVLD